MWVNVHFCTFSQFKIVKIKNAHVLRAYLAIVSVLTLGTPVGNKVYLTIGKKFRWPGCLVTEISAEIWFLIGTGRQRPTICFQSDTTVHPDFLIPLSHCRHHSVAPGLPLAEPWLARNTMYRHSVSAQLAVREHAGWQFLSAQPANK